MLKKKQIFENCIYSVFILLIAVYLFSIFAVNLTGRVWSNFDIYSDAILAKYIWTSGSLFPKDGILEIKYIQLQLLLSQHCFMAL